MTYTNVTSDTYIRPINYAHSEYTSAVQDACDSDSIQGDHSPDTMKFPDNSLTFPWRFAALMIILTGIHTMPVLLVLKSIQCQ